jgi:hypothetical protein
MVLYQLFFYIVYAGRGGEGPKSATAIPAGVDLRASVVWIFHAESACNTAWLHMPLPVSLPGKRRSLSRSRIRKSDRVNGTRLQLACLDLCKYISNRQSKPTLHTVVIHLDIVVTILISCFSTKKVYVNVVNI